MPLPLGLSFPTGARGHYAARSSTPSTSDAGAATNHAARPRQPHPEKAGQPQAALDRVSERGGPTLTLFVQMYRFDGPVGPTKPVLVRVPLACPVSEVGARARADAQRRHEHELKRLKCSAQVLLLRWWTCIPGMPGTGLARAVAAAAAQTATWSSSSTSGAAPRSCRPSRRSCCTPGATRTRHQWDVQELSASEEDDAGGPGCRYVTRWRGQPLEPSWELRRAVQRFGFTAYATLHLERHTMPAGGSLALPVQGPGAQLAHPAAAEEHGVDICSLLRGARRPAAAAVSVPKTPIIEEAPDDYLDLQDLGDILCARLLGPVRREAVGRPPEESLCGMSDREAAADAQVPSTSREGGDGQQAKPRLSVDACRENIIIGPLSPKSCIADEIQRAGASGAKPQGVEEKPAGRVTEFARYAQLYPVEPPLESRPDSGGGRRGEEAQPEPAGVKVEADADSRGPSENRDGVQHLEEALCEELLATVGLAQGGEAAREHSLRPSVGQRPRGISESDYLLTSMEGVSDISEPSRACSTVEHNNGGAVALESAGVLTCVLDIHMRPESDIDAHTTVSSTSDLLPDLLRRCEQPAEVESSTATTRPSSVLLQVTTVPEAGR